MLSLRRFWSDHVVGFCGHLMIHFKHAFMYSCIQFKIVLLFLTIKYLWCPIYSPSSIFHSPACLGYGSLWSFFCVHFLQGMKGSFRFSDCLLAFPTQFISNREVLLCSILVMGFSTQAYGTWKIFNLFELKILLSFKKITTRTRRILFWDNFYNRLIHFKGCIGKKVDCNKLLPHWIFSTCLVLYHQAFEMALNLCKW